jgi:hypothetical protein
LTGNVQPGDWIKGPFWEAAVQVVSLEARDGYDLVTVAGRDQTATRTCVLTPTDWEQITRATRADRRHIRFSGDAFRFRLGIQAHRLRLAHSIDPYAALNASRIDPLPHQFEAVYGHLLARPVVRALQAACDIWVGQQGEQLIVFTEFKDTLDTLVERLGERGYTTTQIHGGMDVKERRRAEQDFWDGKAQVLVATDHSIAGRSQMSEKQQGEEIQITGDGNIIGDGNIVTVTKEYYYGERKGSTSPGASLYLPPKAYHRLVGRFDELERVMSALRDPKHRPMVAIIGLGGIGKTALAREVVERAWDEKLFEYVVWTSSKTEHFSSEDIGKTGASAQGEGAVYGFDTLLSDIGRQCDRVDIAQMPPDQKQAAVKYLLAKKRVLVVMDNLETVPESEKLVADVFQILGQGKVLITSRHHVKHERVLALDLGGFPEDEGVTFLREESTVRGIEVVAQAGRPSLVEIHQVTGGAPLAMKLVVGQISRQPMDVVLDTLKEAAFKGQDYPFYRFVYQHSWDMLEMNARMALVDMSVFPPITGGAVGDVQAISQVEASALWPAMDQLVTLSLLDKIGVAGRERYALHPLTQYFIKSDITKEWAD